MQKERQIIYDVQLKVEALQFNGIQQKFPNHFHDYYVIGYIEKGRRKLTCKNEEYILSAGDLIFFNPYDNHECESLDGDPLVYRNLHIKSEVMMEYMETYFSLSYKPSFRSPVFHQADETQLFLTLHQLILFERSDMFEKEEALIIFLNEILYKYSRFEEPVLLEIPDKIKVVQVYIEENYESKLNLKHLSKMAGMNQYTFIRSFTKLFGLTPFQYLITVRINEAKSLLELGNQINEVALMTGFSDQSHLTRIFKGQIGVTPKLYQDIYNERRR